MSGTNCCYKCDRRTMTCHSTCEDYKKYSDALKKKREQENKERMKNNTYMDYVCELNSSKLKKWKRGTRYEG